MMKGTYERWERKKKILRARMEEISDEVQKIDLDAEPERRYEVWDKQKQIDSLFREIYELDKDDDLQK